MDNHQSNNTKKVYLENIGCERRGLDIAELNRDLINSTKYEVCNNYNIADLIIISTCALSKNQKKATIDRLNYLHQYAPLIIAGCLGSIDFESAKKISSNIFPPRMINELYDFLEITKFNRKQVGRLLENDNVLKTYNLENVWLVRISEGCKGSCSYCAIKKAIGALKSRDLNYIHKLIETGIKVGYRKIQIEAEDTGAYGIDIGQSFPELLEYILDTFPNIEISLIKDLSPKWIIKDASSYSKLLTNNRIKNILIPIQSGSQRILDLMNRGYEITEFLEFIEKVKINEKIWTHIIVGFPSENKNDFELTLEILLKVNPKMLDVFTYQENKTTKSESIYPKVDLPTADNRKSVLEKHFSNKIGSYNIYNP
jgi:threonylcarbamoyladenosine tRNA methylthiotransferase CDKAL1